MARSQPAARIRLLVSDIDGTLLDEEKQLTPAVLAAAEKLRQAGIALCLSSSRPVRGLRMYYHPLGLDTPASGLNGGEIVGADDSILSLQALDAEAARIVIEALDAVAVECWLFTGAEWVIRDPEGAFVPREFRAVQVPPTVVDDVTPFLGRVGKIMGASSDTALLTRLGKELDARLSGRIGAHLSGASYLDVTHPFANKGRAAVQMAEMLGVDPSEMACIGDMFNDVAMLDAAGLAIAMGNAPEPVAAAAHFVTATNQQDGWAKAVEAFVLPRAA